MLAQKAVIVPVNLLERIFAVVKVPEGLANSLNNTGGTGAHEPNELLKSDLTISINIAQAEDGIDLNI